LGKQLQQQLLQSVLSSLTSSHTATAVAVVDDVVDVAPAHLRDFWDSVTGVEVLEEGRDAFHDAAVTLNNKCTQRQQQ